MSADHPSVIKAIIKGRVQGVGYRVFARGAAERLGATGWVRNLNTGDVEVLAEGRESVLNELLTDLLKGPPWGHVADIEIEWEHAEPAHSNFRIRR